MRGLCEFQVQNLLESSNHGINAELTNFRCGLMLVRIVDDGRKGKIYDWKKEREKQSIELKMKKRVYLERLIQ